MNRLDTPAPAHLWETFTALLESNRIMTLATAGDDGPWATPVIYAWEPKPTFYFMSRLSTRHARNILASGGLVSAAIHPSETRPLRGAQMSGVCEVLAGLAALRAIRRYLRRFPAARGRFPVRAVLEESIDIRFFRFTPHAIYLLSEEHYGWGVRHEVPLGAPEAAPHA